MYGKGGQGISLSYSKSKLALILREKYLRWCYKESGEKIHVFRINSPREKFLNGI